jgi:hypothetical protein
VKKIILAGFGAALLVAAIVLVDQLRGGPPKPRDTVSRPLTDVAARPPVVGVDPSESPEKRLARLGPASQPAKAATPPREMPDPSRPPQWTEPLATPGTPQPPDPFVPPPIAVDPNRGRPQE